MDFVIPVIYFEHPAFKHEIYVIHTLIISEMLNVG